MKKERTSWEGKSRWQR